jgi:hypothetical protein
MNPAEAIVQDYSTVCVGFVKIHIHGVDANGSCPSTTSLDEIRLADPPPMESNASIAHLLVAHRRIDVVLLR